MAEELKIKVGRPRKKISINVKEFIDMVKFIKEHPIDRTGGSRAEDVPIPETGRAYWNEALDQVIECLTYIHNSTPMTSAKKVLHDKKLEVYEGDDRVAIYEYVRTQIIEQNGGSTQVYE